MSRAERILDRRWAAHRHRCRQQVEDPKAHLRPAFAEAYGGRVAKVQTPVVLTMPGQFLTEAEVARLAQQIQSLAQQIQSQTYNGTGAQYVTNMTDVWRTWNATVTASTTLAVEPIWQGWVLNSSSITITLTDQVWGNWQQATPEQVEEIRRQQVEYYRAQEVARQEALLRHREAVEQQRLAAARARALLTSLLDAEQKAELADRGRFHVRSNRGRRFCIVARGRTSWPASCSAWRWPASGQASASSSSAPSSVGPACPACGRTGRPGAGRGPWPCPSAPSPPPSTWPATRPSSPRTAPPSAASCACNVRLVNSPWLAAPGLARRPQRDPSGDEQAQGHSTPRQSSARPGGLT